MRDYAKKPNRKKRTSWKRKWRNSMLLGLILVVGLAFLLHRLNRQTAPLYRNKQQTISVSSVSGNTSDKVIPVDRPVANQFDFYTLLSKLPAPATKRKSIAKVSHPVVSTYVLQVASTKNHRAAKAMKNQLVKSGYSASVDTLSIKGRRWYRVLAGPYSEQQSAEKDQRRLYRLKHWDSLLIQQP